MRWIIPLLLLPSLAQAQTATVDQRIANQIGQLVIQNASQATQLEQLQTALKDAQSRVQALESKCEPKPAPAPKDN